MNKKILTLVVPVVAVLICSLLVFTNLDKKVADLFQRPLKSTQESSSVLLINVDDTTVEKVGTYPLNRDVYANSIIALKDLGAAQVVSDISFLDKGLVRVDERYVSEDLTELIEESFARLANDDADLETVMYDVLVSVSHVVDNSDDILASAFKYFENSYLTLTFNSGSVPTENVEEILKSSIAFKNVKAINDTKTPESKSVTPAYKDFLVKAKKAGAVNADPDKDGYLRRVYLFRKYNGEYYGQLILVPILARLGNPDIEISNSKIVLKKAVLADGSTKDIVIPRCEDGSVALKYPKARYEDYNAISLWKIYRLYLQEKQLLEETQKMQMNGYFELWDEDDPVNYLDAFVYLRSELYNGEDEDTGITYADYYAYKDEFWSVIKEYLSEENHKQIIENADYYGLDDEALEMIAVKFSQMNAAILEYESSCAAVKSKVENATGIIGATSTSSSDWGSNQYESFYPNVGAHYVLANQILSQDFVDDSNPVFGIIIAFVICLLYSFLTVRLKGTGRQIIFGISMIVITTVALLLIFVVSKKYIGAVVPVISISTTFVTTTVLGFLTASKDKKFITNAFGQCLSPEVVKEIVANPSSFKLGGQKVEMTAIFTDIQKFSSFSELLSAGQLVALLNYYLTKMSDIIMEERGTVDKYEGDAIIALVGAPVKMEDHAKRAVAAALKMKAAEKVMNEEIIKIASEEKPLDMDDELYEALKIMVKNNKAIFTRIGLNSGEMIAGYMGSENKKNYTMMGNNVNLASRLEGVNKQYSTGGILCSEATRKLLDDEFVVRRLDRVRVVNVNTPIQLYEPLAVKANADESLLTYVKNWETTMDWFVAGTYEKALAGFEKLSSMRPEDNVAKYYIKLLKTFFINGSYPKESDSFGVEYIPEDKVFKLLQK